MTENDNKDLTESTIQHGQKTTHIAVTDSNPPSPFKDWVFPYNVYTNALLIQEGKAAHLHYGLLQDEEISLQVAQRYNMELLSVRLPSPPCYILEISNSLNSILPLLNQHGYEVYSINSVEQQAGHAQEALEAFEAQPESFNVLLFLESAKYIEPLIIFDKALDLLPLLGDLIIIDEFALQRTKGASTKKPHNINHILVLAERFGFELIEHMDLSAIAAPTINYLLGITQVHRQSLTKDLALSNEQWNQLDEFERVYQEKYFNRNCGYALLHFKKKVMPKWRLGVLQECQMLEMLSLFRRVFNHDMAPAMWQWKYASNSGRAIGIWRDKQLIAHYGGINRNILFFGQPQRAVQIGDVMVDMNERGTLTRKGPFFLMAATFLERYIGYGKIYLVGFGFPNERAMKVAERLGLYAEAGRMVEFSWTDRLQFPLWGTRLHIIKREQTDYIISSINQCWQRMAADMQTAIIGVRDWHYLQYRYFDHPNQHYKAILVTNRFNSQARGVLVLRHDSHGCEMVDIIAPLAEIPLLVLHARRVAGMNGDHRLFCRITENFAAYFTNAGGNKQDLDIRVPASTWGNVPAVDYVRNHWWLMSGDTDFR